VLQYLSMRRNDFLPWLWQITYSCPVFGQRSLFHPLSSHGPCLPAVLGLRQEQGPVKQKLLRLAIGSELNIWSATLRDSRAALCATSTTAGDENVGVRQFIHRSLNALCPLHAKNEFEKGCIRLVFSRVCVTIADFESLRSR
jgi:hypothetical protein